MACARASTLASAVLAGSAALAASASARAACSVVEGGTPTPAWHEAILRLERDLAASPCGGVALRVVVTEGGGTLVARAADGLETTRKVTSPAALTAVAFGLLVSAPAEPAPAPPDPRDVPPRDPPTSRHGAPPRDELVSHLSVGVAAGARAAFPTQVVMADVELRADLFVHAWVVTLSMRASPVGVSPRLTSDPDAYEETAVGFGLGRELRAGPVALGLTAGPNLTYIWIENDEANLSTEHAQFRLAALARCSYPVTPRMRLDVTLDGEVAPSGLAHTSFEAGLAPFPAFTVGLRVGAEMAL